MGSFKDDIYPYRFDRGVFAQKLWRNVDSEWNRVTTVGHGSSVPGDVLRCRIVGSGVQCNYAPVNLDKRRVKGILKGWRRSISDRYLDLGRVQQLDYRRHQSVDSAFEVVRQNAPSGAVMFLMNEIERCREPYFFGRNLWDGWGYNEYFSALLHWDDRHCYGLVNALRREQGRFAVGGTPGNLWASVRRWIGDNQNNGVYREFGLRVE